MRLYEDFHSQGTKRIFNNIVIPAGQEAREDIEMTLDALAAHDNVPPFMSRLLIQRFTASDPSPGYVLRVARVWKDSEGNLGRVLRAILMDPEARDPEVRKQLRAEGRYVGKLREPYLRLAHLLRFFKARNAEAPTSFPVVVNFFDQNLGQRPMFAPSVFNFYLPDYRPLGLENVAGPSLISPEMQIATPERLIGLDNLLDIVTKRGLDPRYQPEEKVLKLDYGQIGESVRDVDQYLQALNVFLVAGRLTPENIAAIRVAMEGELTREKKVWASVHLIADSPAFVTFD